jgi:hypothetical protein
MADPLPPPPPVSEPITYRPISGFAVAGFAAACLFAALVVVAAAVALVQGAPFFYPVWVLALPAAGLIVSLVGRNLIRNSEGTLAGEALARAGIWMSLLTGLGYFVYYNVTGLAVTNQANDFLLTVKEDSGFFPHLLKAGTSPADMNAAFLLSLPPQMRGNVRPEDLAGMEREYNQSREDGTPGMLSYFRNHFLVRMVCGVPAGQVQVEPLGVQSWSYENRSYVVRRNYRITTPEVVVEFAVPVESVEGESAGERRKWYVPVKSLPRPTTKLTPLGDGLRALRASSDRAVNTWIKGEVPSPVSFAKVDATSWALLPLPDSQRDHLKGVVRDLVEGKDPARLRTLTILRDGGDFGDWDLVQGKVRIIHPFRINIDPQGSYPPFILEGRLVSETKEPVDPANLAAMTAEPTWSVQGVSITRAAPLSKTAMMMKKGGPGPP